MAAIAMLGAVAVGAGAVSAATNGQPGTLAQKLASAFNLDPTKVQAVIDQNHTDQQQKHEATYETRLGQAVTDGQLTAAQKQAVLDEHNKLTSELDNAKNLSGTDQRNLMNKVRQEAQDWATKNNIDQKWLVPGGRHMHGGTMSSHNNGGTNGDTTPSPSPSPST